jgi:hypothetical protein
LRGLPRPRTLSAGSVGDSGVTVHRVRLGPEVQKIKIAKSAGVVIGDGNTQVNRYRYNFARPRVSLDRLFEGHPARLRSFARLVANPHSRAANSAFRRHLSAKPERPESRVLFSSRLQATTVRISARADEHGALVVENSRGIKVSDHGVQRNDFNYKLVGQEISLERTLRDRSDLARSLAMTVRYPVLQLLFLGL